MGNRQHYLRWLPGITELLLEDAGVLYDSTLGYAERPGFRCGTAREFAMYDVIGRKPLAIRQRPLVLMEESVMDEQYLGLGTTQSAIDVMSSLKAITHQFAGNFTLLWHNSSLKTVRQRQIYREIIA